MSLDDLLIETHLAHGCNLSCEGCSHFSNFHSSGILPLETAEEWYRQWGGRIRPAMFSLLGGEPALHPSLCQHILLARRYWPHSRIRIVSNGFLLHRHPDLPRILQEIGDAVLQVSRHYDGAPYDQRFTEVFDLLEAWQGKYKIKIKVTDSYTDWTRRYLQDGDTLIPFSDHDVRRSWEVCSCRKCKQLHLGKLWKCPILAYLPMAGQKRPLAKEWDLSYVPLSPDCSDSELTAFLTGEEESFCALCPAYERPFKKGNPL